MSKKTYYMMVVFIFICAILYSLTSFSYAGSTINETILRDMIIDTADAYYNLGSLYQYDQYRENIYASPEEANEYNPIYGTCSSFVYQVYYSTLGIKIPLLTKNHVLNAREYNNNNSSDYVRYYINSGNSHPSYYSDGISTSNYISTNPHTALTSLASLTTEALNFLEKGDIVVQGFGSNGHTGMVYEIDKNNNILRIIDNNGSVYDYSNYTDNTENRSNGGSLAITNFSSWLQEGNFYNNGTWAGDVAFIKIIDNSDEHYVTYGNNGINPGGLTITNQNNYKAAVVRSQYNDFKFEKSYEIRYPDTSSTKSLYADLYSEIIYRIKIANFGNTTKSNMEIIESIDTSKVDYIEATMAGASYNAFKNNQIVFSNITIPANNSVILTYKVKVKCDTSLYNNGVITTTSMVNGYLPLKEIQIKVGHALDTHQKNLIKSASKTTEGSSASYINNVYNKAFGISLNLSDGVISYNSGITSPVKYTKINKNSDIVLSNLYGLKIGSANGTNSDMVNAFEAWKRNNGDTINSDTSSLGEYVNRRRILKVNMLEMGDIIITNGTVYLYINDSGTSKLLSNKDDESISNVNTFLTNLVGNNYVVLRPALSTSFPRTVHTIIYDKNTEDTVYNMPSNTEYEYACDGSTINLPAASPSRNGYMFAGWRYNSYTWYPGTAWKKSNAMPSYTLTAIWDSSTTSGTTVSEDLVKNDVSFIIKNKEISSSVSISSFMSGITTTNTLYYFDSDYNEITDRSYIKTGDKLIISTGEVFTPYTVLLRGDINGDGLANTNDLNILVGYVKTKQSEYNFSYVLACDMTEDNFINITDVSKFLREKRT